MSDYLLYASGVEKAADGSYDFLVSGRTDYSSSGVMIKGDTTSQPGLAIRMDSTDNTFVDHRSTADKSLSFRLQDHTTESITPLLVLKKDTLSDTAVNAAEITGRMKASQFYLAEPDTRDAVDSGLYVGVDNSYTARIRINKGDGTGGFVFTTNAADGSIDKVNMLLNTNGTITIPQYERSQNADDNENYAIATFDAEGRLGRGYQQNLRFQSLESRTTATEADKTDTSIRINEIIRRLNSLSIFSTDMSELVLTPGFTFPQAGLYLQDNGMTNIDGSFNAYVVYPDYRAYQLNSTTMMVTGDPLVVPFEKTGWTRIGDYIEGDNFSISTYFGTPVMQQSIQLALQRAKKVENFSSTTQYKGLSPWSGAKWMSVITVR